MGIDCIRNLRLAMPSLRFLQQKQQQQRCTRTYLMEQNVRVLVGILVGMRLQCSEFVGLRRRRVTQCAVRNRINEWMYGCMDVELSWCQLYASSHATAGTKENTAHVQVCGWCGDTVTTQAAMVTCSSSKHTCLFDLLQIRLACDI